MYTTILTSLLLVLITAAEGPRWRPSTWPPPTQAPYYWGDMLNITKCYCDGVNGDKNKGYYYQFDYRNFHNAQVYTLAWTCDSDAADIIGSGTVGSQRVNLSVPECWNARDSLREEKKKLCVKSYNADIFCFELGNKADPYDYYYFNQEKRGLPNNGIVEFPPDQCTALCRDKVGGKVVASECISNPCGATSMPSSAI